MPLLRALALAAAVAAAALFGPAASAFETVHPAGLGPYVGTAVGGLEDYWRGMAARHGFRWTSPTVELVFDAGVSDECPEAEHAYYSGEALICVDFDSADADSFLSNWRAGERAVILYTLGHEFGHHVQALLGTLDDPDSVTLELQADCLAGLFYRAHVEASGGPNERELQLILANARSVGDDPALAPSARTHGTPAQRAAAFLRGYEAGNRVAAC